MFQPSSYLTVFIARVEEYNFFTCSILNYSLFTSLIFSQRLALLLIQYYTIVFRLSLSFYHASAESGNAYQQALSRYSLLQALHLLILFLCGPRVLRPLPLFLPLLCTAGLLATLSASSLFSIEGPAIKAAFRFLFLIGQDSNA